MSEKTCNTCLFLIVPLRMPWQEKPVDCSCARGFKISVRAYSRDNVLDKDVGCEDNYKPRTMPDEMIEVPIKLIEAVICAFVKHEGAGLALGCKVCEAVEPLHRWVEEKLRKDSGLFKKEKKDEN